MAELTFGCSGAHVVRYAATPTFALSLNITETTGVRLHAIALRCQIRIEPQRRRYTADEARRLHELFGDTHSWGETARPLQLATLTALVPGFTARTEVELPVPCSYDLEVASARYLQVLEDGVIPLLLMFSGTVFIDHGHTYSVELIPWSLEVPFPMPARVWHDVIDEHFPGSAWLRCSRQTLDALSEFKSAYALPTWDAALSALLGTARMSLGRSDDAEVLTPEELTQVELVWERDDVAPEPRYDAPAAEDALEPETTVHEAEAETAELTSTAAEDTATEETATEDPAAAETATEDPTAETATEDPTAAETAPDGAPPEPQDTPLGPQDTAPAEATPAEPTPSEPAPAEAVLAEAPPEKRHNGTTRRRTGAAPRRTTVPRTRGGRAGGMP